MNLDRLSQPDSKALDALIDAKFDLAAVPEEHRVRAARIKGLLGLLDAYPAASMMAQARQDDGLCHRTMSFVRRHRRREQERSQEALPALSLVSSSDSQDLNDPTALRFPSFRLNVRDVIGLAASVVLLIGIFGPTMANARSHAIRQSCRGNMSGVALGLDAYASDYRDSLPIAHQIVDGNDWYHSLANSANLFLIARSGYTSLETLACPGNACAITDDAYADENHNWPDLATSSFSFQNLLGSASRPLWRLAAAVPLLSDRNPFEVALWQDAPPCAVNSNAPCHGPDGQNILMSDGCVMWMTNPVINGDNIWLPQGMPVPQCGTVKLQGNELPTYAGDVMLIQ
ncbi:MAG: hypothetical protein D8M59_04725 [Planctomycetes bacterium]|nr:hypothetical protein [Planctomycetota bacterium]NOG55813.1 hypothetical protein [Planctomycetota bacterium]